MRSPYCTFRDRLITLTVCVCGVLAFSTTLSADTYTFVPGVGISGLTYLSTSGIGPYGGTLKDTNTGVTSPNSIFFCLTGNQSYLSTETENQNVTAPSTASEEEAAFLVSLMLTDKAATGVTLSTIGTGNSKQVVVSGGNVSAFELDLGQIQFAIWYVMGTLPSAQASAWGYANVNNISDSNVRADVIAAQAGYSAFANSPNFQVFIPNNYPNCGSGQAFISVPPSVPEPGTMVLFGTGALLMALGGTRRLLARRPR